MYCNCLLITNIHKIFETNSSFHVIDIERYGKSLISIFQENFANTDRISISAGGLSTMQ